jgi:nucleotide-binding universal stress UspA family protein
MFKRILIPTDGSTAANKTARAGIALASRLGAKVVACYAVEDLRPIFGPRLMVGQKMIDEVNKRTREVGQKHVDAIGRMAKAAGVPFGSLVTKVYPPHEGIIDAAKKMKCDVIFISSHGRSGFSKLVMGSVTQKVLMRARIPVVVCR